MAPTDLLTDIAQGPWALLAMFGLVTLDAILVVVPGEAAVTALGALATATGSPPLWAVIAVAGAAAVTGDSLWYGTGRLVGLHRWGWMRTARAQTAFAWASVRLHRNAAVIVFTARFIPFARIAVTLTAGATHMAYARFLVISATASLAWATYQAVIGGVIGALIPGSPLLAVIVSIVVAIGLGVAIDVVLARRAPSRRAHHDAGAPGPGAVTADDGAPGFPATATPATDDAADRGENGRMPPRIAMPARLSDADGADPRVALANAIFDDVAALVRAEDLDVVVVRGTDLDGFDGVVLPGGGDIDPARYGGDTAAPCYDVNPAQDDLDLGVLAAAVERGIPVLGVCRGLQVLNVAFGGTLVEDMPHSDVGHTPGGEGGELEWAWHPVSVVEGSRLRAELDGETIAVASGHHQAIRDLGTGLVATAVAGDGVVEAIEHETLPILAVQWHPEAEGTPPSLAAAPFAVFADLVREGRIAAR
ncbi:gamma-glutamyl-gamma-aminobutyrate hydrolase family protein [Microbacterium dextranolyticum]|uniref:VTT domain-containing protein n=1 Tax=Microbacterium dextranolyticum TaxID=36806 RepID=A0A9W6HPI5_9MICO|nr:gamma-glutamyl-gamma-aminobutyrate hydrolase family protein [Microbacterium dextranolyticum]MBM7462394.1 gamma-glutamyl-gamma-aminobutyrate hydrolase PuuD/membrane protein DedA with SNARE-associated domain [Microbacterium dextranolyticum]GLJ96773.1 hypothetical protein GCM10017591_28360 [Microbacterium dextranolyticum]